MKQDLRSVPTPQPAAPGTDAPMHTKGPWSINDWPQATTDIAIGAVGTPLIAKVPLRDVSINEQKANAKLIAAAPDLLDALTRLRNAEKAPREEWIAALQNSDAAITKATGVAA